MTDFQKLKRFELVEIQAIFQNKKSITFLTKNINFDSFTFFGGHLGLSPFFWNFKVALSLNLLVYPHWRYLPKIKNVPLFWTIQESSCWTIPGFCKKNCKVGHQDVIEAWSERTFIVDNWLCYWECRSSSFVPLVLISRFIINPLSLWHPKKWRLNTVFHPFHYNYLYLLTIINTAVNSTVQKQAFMRTH